MPRSFKLYNRFSPKIEELRVVPQTPGVVVVLSNYLQDLPVPLRTATFNYYKSSPILYIGTTNNLRARLKDHLQLTAQNSTLRKSLGTLLSLDRTYVTRRTYQFTSEHESQLNAWIYDNLYFLYLPTEDFESEELDLLNTFNPPMNLRIRDNPVNAEFRAYLTEMRK
ncbi:MAG: GIY-YIG nuclease family protein [Firmicutes bacterium]|nr:GIY-YIG nuclease family protein [Bacillota bacterium]